MVLVDYPPTLFPSSHSSFSTNTALGQLVSACPYHCRLVHHLTVFFPPLSPPRAILDFSFFLEQLPYRCFNSDGLSPLRGTPLQAAFPSCLCSFFVSPQLFPSLLHETSMVFHGPTTSAQAPKPMRLLFLSSLWGPDALPLLLAHCSLSLDNEYPVSLGTIPSTTFKTTPP